MQIVQDRQMELDQKMEEAKPKVNDKKVNFDKKPMPTPDKTQPDKKPTPDKSQMNTVLDNPAPVKAVETPFSPFERQVPVFLPTRPATTKTAAPPTTITAPLATIAVTRRTPLSVKQPDVQANELSKTTSKPLVFNQYVVKSEKVVESR
jgi:hypothetical protein